MALGVARSHVGWGLAASLLLHVTGIAALTLALPRLNVRPGVIRRVELAIVQAPPPSAANGKAALPPSAAATVDVSVEPAGLLAAAATPARADKTSSTPAAPDLTGTTGPLVTASAEPPVTAAAAPPVSASAAPPLTAAAAPRVSAAAAPQVTAAPSPTAQAPKPASQANSVRKRASKPAAAPPAKLQSSVRPDPRSDGSALERVLRQIAATTELTQDERRRAMLVVLRTWEDPSGKHSADELIEALLKNVRAARAVAPDAATK